MTNPVAVFAYNRGDLLKQTLHALEKATDFQERQVYIYCDGSKGISEEEVVAVNQAAAIAQVWARKHGATVLRSERNSGLRKSIETGVTEVVKKHGRVIVLEDDIIVSGSFLQYMDTALERYKDQPKIWQVSGYFTPTNRRWLPCGLLRVPGCWGWGTWDRAWTNYCGDAAALINGITELDRSRFNINDTYDYLGVLQANATGSLNTWQVRWYASMFIHGALALYPGVSQTRNIGFDQRGTNCSTDKTASRFLRQNISMTCPAFEDVSNNLNESEQLLEEMTSFFRWQAYVWSRPSLYQRVASKIRRWFC